MRIDSAQLAERMDSVVVEDRFAIDAGAQDLVAFEVTVGTASSQSNVVNSDFIFVIAVEVTESNPNILTSISAQINIV